MVVVRNTLLLFYLNSLSLLTSTRSLLRSLLGAIFSPGSGTGSSNPCASIRSLKRYHRDDAAPSVFQPSLSSTTLHLTPSSLPVFANAWPSITQRRCKSSVTSMILVVSDGPVDLDPVASDPMVDLSTLDLGAILAVH